MTDSFSGHLAPFGGLLGHCRFWRLALTAFGFGLDHFDLARGVKVSWLSLGGLGGLGDFCRGDGGGGGKVFTPWAGLEDVDVFDPMTPQLRWMSTGGTHLQVDLLYPS